MDIVFVGSLADFEELDALLEGMVEPLELDAVLEEMMEAEMAAPEEPVENVVPEDPEDDEDDEDVVYTLTPKGLRLVAEMCGVVDESTLRWAERWYEERNQVQEALDSTLEVTNVFYELLLDVVENGLPIPLYEEIRDTLARVEYNEGS